MPGFCRSQADGMGQFIWATIVSLWRLEELRYGRDLGYKADCDRFLKAVEELYPMILKWQKEVFS